MLKLRHLFKAATLCLTALLCVAASAEEKRKVAVLQPEGNAAVTNMNKANVRGALTEIIVKAGAYTAISRNHIDQMLKEQGFQRSEMADSSKAKELGQMLGADLICVTELLKEKGELNIECSIIDVETGEIANSASEFLEDDSNASIRKAVEEIVNRMFGKETPTQMRARLEAERAAKEAKEEKKEKGKERRGRFMEKFIDGAKDVAGTVVGNKLTGGSGLGHGLPGDRGKTKPKPKVSLSGLDDEIASMIMADNTNTSWVKTKANVNLKVNTSNLTVTEEDRASGSAYSVSGGIAITGVNVKNGKESVHTVKIEGVTGTDEDMLKRLIKDKVKSQRFMLPITDQSIASALAYNLRD